MLTAGLGLRGISGAWSWANGHCCGGYAVRKTGKDARVRYLGTEKVDCGEGPALLRHHDHNPAKLGGQNSRLYILRSMCSHGPFVCKPKTPRSISTTPCLADMPDILQTCSDMLPKAATVSALFGRHSALLRARSDLPVGKPWPEVSPGAKRVTNHRHPEQCSALIIR